MSHSISSFANSAEVAGAVVSMTKVVSSRPFAFNAAVTAALIAVGSRTEETSFGVLLVGIVEFSIFMIGLLMVAELSVELDGSGGGGGVELEMT